MKNTNNSSPKYAQYVLKGDDKMKHVRALAIKFISSLVLLYMILGVAFDMSFGNVFLISLVLGAVSYLIGDLFILPKTNNTIATIADFGLAFLLIWLIGDSITYGDDIVTAAFASAVGVALFEYFFHKYMDNIILKQEANNRISTLRYQTEASEELTPRIPNRKYEDEDEL